MRIYVAESGRIRFSPKEEERLNARRAELTPTGTTKSTWKTLDSSRCLSHSLPSPKIKHGLHGSVRQTQLLWKRDMSGMHGLGKCGTRYGNEVKREHETANVQCIETP